MPVELNGVEMTTVQRVAFLNDLGALPYGASSLAFQKPLRVGFAGDSIADGFADRNGSSPFAFAAAELYPCEYQTVLASGVGGTSSSNLVLLENMGGTDFPAQIVALEAMTNPPDVVIVQTVQNDYLGTVAHCDTAMAYLVEYSERALVAGVKLVVLCSKPPKSSSPDVALALQYMNSLIDRYCRDTPGNYYWDTFGAWRSTSAADTTGVDWRGSIGGVDVFSYDGTHPSPAGNRSAAAGIVPVLQRFARPLAPMPNVAVAYNDASWPYGNLFGAEGLMMGTSGQLNGVDNAGVAGSAADSATRWALTAGDGITVTPTIVLKDDGYRYQQLVLSGTASADTTVLFQFPYYFDVAAGLFIGEALVYCNDLVGVAGITGSFSGLNEIDFTGDAEMGWGTTQLHFRTEPGTFSNADFSTRNNSIRLNIKSGQTVSGNVQIGRAGVFRIG